MNNEPKEEIELTGPTPKPRPAVSGRFMLIGAAIVLIAGTAVIWGFEKRIGQKAKLKQSENTATVASDAAAPPELPSTVSPVTALSQPNNPTPAPGVAPLENAVATVAHPFPPQNQAAPPVAAQPVANYQPAPVYQPAPEAQVDPRKAAMARAIARAQAAEEAPTSATAQQTAQAPKKDPLDIYREALAPLMGPAPAAVTGNPTITGANPQQAASISVLDGPNGQRDKERFKDGGSGYLNATRVAPLSRFVLQRGAVIPATLAQKVVSDLPGDLIAIVERDVYDSPSQTFMLIPAGSRLVGEYNSRVTYGQNRVQVAWTAIYFPDGSFVDIDKMPAQSADGGAGLHDQTDNHIKRLIGGVALSSMFAAGLAISQNRSNGNNSVLTYPSNTQVATSAIGTQAAQVGQQITSRNLNVQPTLKIRPGEIFGVFVTRDILFPAPYEAMK